MKRQRPVTSCLSCRKRRVRCDRAHPTCLRCATSRLECKYDESATAGSSDRSAVTTSQTPSSTARAYSQGSDLRNRQTSTDEPGKRRKSTEKGQLSVHHGGRSTYVGSTYWANAIPSEVNRSEHFSSDEPSPEPTPFPKWPPKRNETMEPMSHKFRPPRSWDKFWTQDHAKKCKYCGREYNISCLLSLLPSKEVCEKLCGVFFARVFPLIPILHVEGFSHDFHSFWEGVHSDIQHDSELGPVMRQNPSFLCLLSAILFAAVSSTPKSQLQNMLGNDTEVKTGDVYFIAMVSATLTGFPRRPSIYSLAAYIFAQSQFVREEEFSDAPDFISTSFRIALGMGLHRYIPEAGFSIAESETRCRLWWYILHLDVMSSCSSGLSPLFIDEKMANTKAICQYDKLESDESGEQNEIDVRYLVASQRYAITKEIRGVLKRHFEDALQSVEQVHAMENKLHKVAQETSAITNLLLKSKENTVYKHSRSTSFDASRATSSSTTSLPFDRVWKLEPDADDKEVINFSTWAAILLHMMIHKAYCVLYHPLFRDPSLVAHESIRKNAVLHAQAFIQLFTRVCNDPVSESYHWMYPGTYQPLSSLSLLLADLLQHPHSDDASMSHGLVDAIFELYQVDEGIVSKNDTLQRQLSPSGRDAWTMLVRLRRKALHQLGVDHHVLLPSNLISSNSCICGERIALAPNDGPDNGSQQQWSSRQSDNLGGSTPPPRWELPDEQNMMTPGQMLLGNVEFDWRAWDNALGTGGMMP